MGGELALELSEDVAVKAAGAGGGGVGDVLLSDGVTPVGLDADKGVAADSFAAFDGLEEKGLGGGVRRGGVWLGEAKKGGDGGFEVGDEGAEDGDEGVGGGEAGEVGEGGAGACRGGDHVISILRTSDEVSVV